MAVPQAKKPVAVLISGRGSNMLALAEAAAARDFPAEIVLVLSDKPGAAGLQRAAEMGIETGCIDRAAFSSRKEFEAALEAQIAASGAEILCLAGFMRLLSGRFVEAWGDRILNIHPSLLPAFKGLDTHIRAIEAGVRFTGCTVHIVRPAMDDGPIVAQAAVPLLPGDTPEALAARILEAEHTLYPRALAALASGRLKVEGGRCLIDGARWPETALASPLSDGGG